MGQSLRRFHAVHIPVFPHKAFRQKGQVKNLEYYRKYQIQNVRSVLEKTKTASRFLKFNCHLEAVKDSFNINPFMLDFHKKVLVIISPNNDRLLKKHSCSMLMQISRVTINNISANAIIDIFADLDIEELQLTYFCNKPKSLGDLEKITKFNKRELKIMYRGFKQECPNGILDTNKFIQIYKSFFPLGNAEPYAFHIHRTMLKRCDGPITFEKLVTELSLLTFGNTSEKLEWVFDLYDVEKNGFISRKDLTDVVYSIYQLLGDRISPPITKATIIEHVDLIFQKLNMNSCEVISTEEFKSAYLNDSQFLINTQVLQTHL